MLESLLPNHKCGLYLQHNAHRDTYEEIGQFIVDQDLKDAFESHEALIRAIETDNLWTLQWYPNTPIGFNLIAGPTLESVLRRAQED